MDRSRGSLLRNACVDLYSYKPLHSYCASRQSTISRKFFNLFLTRIVRCPTHVRRFGYIKLQTKWGGSRSPPLLTLALSFLYALTRSKSDAKGICLRTLLGCWCDYTKFYGYKPLGCDAMEGQPLEEKLM